MYDHVSTGSPGAFSQESSSLMLQAASSQLRNQSSRSSEAVSQPGIKLTNAYVLSMTDLCVLSLSCLYLLSHDSCTLTQQYLQGRKEGGGKGWGCQKHGGWSGRLDTISLWCHSQQLYPHHKNTTRNMRAVVNNMTKYTTNDSCYKKHCTQTTKHNNIFVYIRLQF